LDATAELGQHEIAWERNRLGELIADEKDSARIAELDRAMRELGNMREQIKSANKLKAHQQDDALERFSKRFDDPEKPTFVWQLDFAEVFHRNGSQKFKHDDFLAEDEHRAGTSGFDIIVANPPYVRMERFKEIKFELRSRYAIVHSERADLYCYFYARGFELLTSNGVLAFISSNKFFRAGYGEPLRKFLTKATEIQIAIDFGDLPIFEATTYPAIIVARNAKPRINHNISTLNVRTEDELARFTELQFTPLAQEDFEWRLEEPATLQLLQKMKTAGMTLGDFVKGRIYRGIVTGFNEAFIIDRGQRKSLMATSRRAADVMRPYVGGKNVRRWVCEDSGKWLLYLPNGISTNGLDAVLEHLRPFRKQLESRATDQNWYELQQPQEKFVKAYERPKIIFPDIAKTLRFAFDSKGTFFSNTAYCIASDDLYLLGVLNSSAVQYFYIYLSAQIRGGYVRLWTQYVEQIPIPNAPTEERIAISKLVQKCLDAKGERVSQVEAEINERVARLYGLTRDETKVIREMPQ
jgi:hypothetical protein